MNEKDIDMVRSEDSGALVSTNQTKYLQARGSKLAEKQAQTAEQRIITLERSVSALTRLVQSLVDEKPQTKKKKD